MTILDAVKQAVVKSREIASRSTTPLDRITSLRSELERLFRILTQHANPAPSSLFACIVYCEQQQFSQTAVSQSHAFRKAANDVVHGKREGTDQDIQLGQRTFLAIAVALGVTVPEEYTAPITAANLTEPDAAPKTTPLLPFLVGERVSGRVVVLESHGNTDTALHRVVMDRDGEPYETTARLQGVWRETEVWPYAVLWLHDAAVEEGNLLVADNQTLVVLQPDIILSARDISVCYKEQNGNIALYFGSELKPFLGSPDLTAGNLVTSTMTGLLADSKVDDTELVRRAADGQQEEIALLSAEDGNKAVAKITGQVPQLRKIAEFMRQHDWEAESFYLAPRLGLQGKPDAVVHRGNGKSHVLELKSGKRPAANWARPLELRLGQYPTTARAEHAVQAACYALMLREIDPEWKGEAAVVYTSVSDGSMQVPVPLSHELRTDIIVTRNAIIEAQYRLITGKAPFPEAAAIPTTRSMFNSDLFAMALDLTRLCQSVANGEATHADTWLLERIQQVYREHWAAWLGEANGERIDSGCASLWNDTDLASKAERGEILWNLQPVNVTRGTSGLECVFESTAPMVSDSEFREGDLILMYPHNGRHANPTTDRLLKGVFTGREGSNGTQVRLTLREVDAESFLKEHQTWVIESNASANSMTAQIRALWGLRVGSNDRRPLLMGLTSPRTGAPLSTSGDTGDPIADLVTRAAAAPDYFLVQGPPGTGKTRRFLPRLVKRILERAPRPILALAFTNRAVDEMRDALREIAPLDPFRGIEEEEGAKQGVDALREGIDGAKLFVMTVHKARQRLAWLKTRGLQAVIVDEASQLMTSAIAGLLGDDIPFILIGDDRQLPPIVRDRIQVKGRDFTADLDRPSPGPVTSMFEDLATACRDQGWEHALGMLESQARMHEEIQEFPNINAYSGHLKTVELWQSAPSSPWSNVEALPLQLRTNRVCLVDVQSLHERQPRVNRAEAELAARIAALFVNSATQVDLSVHSRRKLVGIVAPFRAQCAAIRNELTRWGLQDVVDVETVERFQGSERVVMVVSTTAADAVELARTESLSRDRLVDRKLNVAITRACEHLIVLGDTAVLEDGTVSQQYVTYLRERGKVVCATNLKW